MLGVIALFVLVVGAAYASRARPYGAFFILLLATEFFYVEVGGGAARPYHFVAIVVISTLAKHAARVMTSRVFGALILFVCVNIVAIVLAEKPGAALFSFALLAANVAVAVATSLVLLSGAVDITRLKRIIAVVTQLSIAWGVIQIAALRIGGMNLGLSLQQQSQLAELGFGPGLRTEANSLGKYTVVIFLLFLPEFVERWRSRSNRWLFAFLLVGALMNFTRSALFGLALSVPFIFAWYVRRGRAVRLSKTVTKVAAIAALGLGLVFTGALSVSEYARYKMEMLFNRDEILLGSSSTFRVEMMRFIIEDALSEPKKMLIGNGWGQTFYYWAGYEVRAGGGDGVAVLGFGGLLGAGMYLVYMLAAIGGAGKIAKVTPDQERRLLAEGTMFSLIGMACAGQMAGFLNSPEYWMLLGVGIFLTARAQNRRTAVVRVGGA
jgi:hypothetical protein